MLDVLRQRAEPLGVDDLAAVIGLHPNTVRSHLDVLIGAGYVTSQSLQPDGPGRPRTVYTATATSSATDDGSNYRMLAEMLTVHLARTSAAPGSDAVTAGQAWAGPRVESPAEPLDEPAAVESVVQLLSDSGFKPRVSDDGSQIELLHCPFRDLAEAHRDVVCGAHLGILQGAFERLGAPVSATRLLPFVEPGLCVAVLGPSVAHDDAR